MKKIGELANKYESLLTKAEKLYLTKISFSRSNFFGLPKAHKSKEIDEAIQQQNKEYVEIHEPDDLNMRTIVGGPNCPTRPFTQLIDIILKPFLIHIKSYNNLDFLRKCSRKNNDSTTLVTFDVKSLYTSIPHNCRLEAIRFWIEKHPDSLHLNFSKGFALGSMKIISENKNCTLNDEFYRQISGTAIGTIFVPAYATLIMSYFEVHFYNICELK